MRAFLESGDELKANAGLREEATQAASAWLTTVERVDIALPTEPLAVLDLERAAQERPFVLSFAHLAEAADAQSVALRADRFPRITLGADWIETGSWAAEVDGNGDDAVIVSGISVPLW